MQSDDVLSRMRCGVMPLQLQRSIWRQVGKALCVHFSLDLIALILDFIKTPLQLAEEKCACQDGHKSGCTNTELCIICRGRQIDIWAGGENLCEISCPGFPDAGRKYWGEHSRLELARQSLFALANQRPEE